MEARTFFSVFAISDKGIKNDYLKFCFLWYEEVLYESLGRVDVTNLVEEFKLLNKKEFDILTDVIVPLEKKVPEDIIYPNGKFDFKGFPRWGKEHQNYTYPEPKDAFEYTHNKLLKIVQKKWGITKPAGIDVEHMEGAARAAYNAVCMWERINPYIPCILESTYMEKEAMIAISEYKSDSLNSLRPIEIFEMIIPELKKLSWEQVIRLKKESKINNLKDAMIRLTINSRAETIQELKKEFDSLAAQLLDQIFEGSRPRTKKVAFESILSNLPGIPYVNPFSFYFGVRDIILENKKQKNVGWIYSLRDLKKTVNKEIENFNT